MNNKKLKSLENNIHIDLLRNILPYLHINDRINLKNTSNYYKSFFKKNQLHKKVHIIYVIDVTASMVTFFDKILSTIQPLNIYFNNLDATYSIIEFADHESNLYTDSESDSDQFTVRVNSHMKDVIKCNNILSDLNLDNGGDIPEAIADAFHEVNKLNCSSKDTNIVIFFSDAFPHGENYNEDSFPNGCPCGINYEKELEVFNKNNIKFIYFTLNLRKNSYTQYIDIFKSKISKLVNYIELSNYINIKNYILNCI